MHVYAHQEILQVLNFTYKAIFQVKYGSQMLHMYLIPHPILYGILKCIQ